MAGPPGLPPVTGGMCDRIHGVRAPLWARQSFTRHFYTLAADHAQPRIFQTVRHFAPRHLWRSLAWARIRGTPRSQKERLAFLLEVSWKCYGRSAWPSCWRKLLEESRRFSGALGSCWQASGKFATLLRRSCWQASGRVATLLRRSCWQASGRASQRCRAAPRTRPPWRAARSQIRPRGAWPGRWRAWRRALRRGARRRS